MAGIIDAINRIDTLCATVGIRSPAGAGFEAALARALGDNPPASADASTAAPAGATAAPAGPADVPALQAATGSGALTLPVAGQSPGGIACRRAAPFTDSIRRSGGSGLVGMREPLQSLL